MTVEAIATFRMNTSVVLLIAIITLLACTHAKIGYFWHITDFHYDPSSSQDDKRKNCRREDGSIHHSPGPYGDYDCDSTLVLIQSALRFMRKKHTENIEYVLWTGDIVTSRYNGTVDAKYQAIRNMTELLRTTFSSHFVFPALGHTDPAPSDALTSLWSHWLPLEALQTLKNGGYYTIEQTQSKLRIIVLNTNLFTVRQEGSAQALNQWEWLQTVLEKAHLSKEKVYIVGHAPPGYSAREAVLARGPNERYERLARRHADVIAGQFFGHLQADTFRLIYDDDRPVSWILVAPALSPGRGSNPGLRLYKFDTDSGKVLDYTQFYLDLAAANRAGAGAVEGAEWAVEYDFVQYYGLADVSPASLHFLADKMRDSLDTALWDKYLRAYSVRREGRACGAGGAGRAGGAGGAGAACALQHYCGATRVSARAHAACLLAPPAPRAPPAASHAPPALHALTATLLALLPALLHFLTMYYLGF